MRDLINFIKIVSVLVTLLVFPQSKTQIVNPPRTGTTGWLYTRNPNYIKFLLFPNPENEDYSEEIFLGYRDSLRRSQFDKSKPTIFMIHGLLGGVNILTDVQQVKNAYLSVLQNANLIMVDYRELAGTHFPLVLSWLNGPLSLPANLNVGIVGKRVAAFIGFMMQSGAISDLKSVHIVGHSLGCHVAGRAGEIIAKTTGKKISRISGLDCPFGQFVTNLLDKSDADFVDLTHTSFGLAGAFGTIGHVDFFINGAAFAQPNCQNALPITDPYCAHESSVFYFAKSIRNKNIFGCKCEWCARKPKNCKTTARYGQFTDTKLRGTYYVELPAKSSRNLTYDRTHKT